MDDEQRLNTNLSPQSSIILFVSTIIVVAILVTQPFLIALAGTMYYGGIVFTLKFKQNQRTAEVSALFWPISLTYQMIDSCVSVFIRKAGI